FAVVTGPAVEIIAGIFTFAFIPLQRAQELGGVGDDRLVGVALGADQRQDIDAGDVIFQLHARVLAGDVALFGIDERFDVFETALHHRIVRPDLAGLKQSRQDDAGCADFRLFVLTPAAVLVL